MPQTHCAPFRLNTLQASDIVAPVVQTSSNKISLRGICEDLIIENIPRAFSIRACRSLISACGMRLCVRINKLEAKGISSLFATNLPNFSAWLNPRHFKRSRCNGMGNSCLSVLWSCKLVKTASGIAVTNASAASETNRYLRLLIAFFKTRSYLNTVVKPSRPCGLRHPGCVAPEIAGRLQIGHR